MTGERQKAHTYYRCHTSGCPNISIREDRLKEQVVFSLQNLQITDDDRNALRARFEAWLLNSTPDQLTSSVKLRIADASTRLDRLTDLLVDGTIDKPSFETRRQNTEFELQQLKEEEKRLTSRQKSIADLDELLSMACDLSGMFSCANPKQKRALLHNCAGRITVQRGTVHIESTSWLDEVHDLLRDPDQAPSADILGIKNHAEAPRLNAHH